jgi:hypothetical protein
MTSEMWKELHRRALLDHTEGKDDMAWINKWSAKLPRFTTGCKCNEHWGKWLSQNRPDFKTRDSYFAWTVRAHNAVNLRLKKPQLEVAAAKLIYKGGL